MKRLRALFTKTAEVAELRDRAVTDARRIIDLTAQLKAVTTERDDALKRCVYHASRSERLELVVQLLRIQHLTSDTKETS